MEPGGSNWIPMFGLHSSRQAIIDHPFLSTLWLWEFIKNCKPFRSVCRFAVTMKVTEAHFDLFIFAPLYSKGRHTPSQELKVALFGALLRQDLEYLEQCPLDTGVCDNILRAKNNRFRLAFFFGGDDNAFDIFGAKC